MYPAVKKAIFPVGGLGTRFLPATKAIPKEMLPVLDKPLIQYAVEEALASGIEELIFVTGKGKTAIEDHFDRTFELEVLLEQRHNIEALKLIRSLQLDPGKVVYVRQQEPLGLGHAIWCARHLIGDEPFAVLLADDFIVSSQPCLKQLISAYQKQGGNWAAVMEVTREETARYGILDIATQEGPVFHTKGLVEKPTPTLAPSQIAIVGRYLLSPSLFDILHKRVQGFDATHTPEIQITDALASLLETEAFYGLAFSGQRFDCGTLPGMFAATLAAAQVHPELKVFANTLLSNTLSELPCPL